jgi:hypothetical protein
VATSPMMRASWSGVMSAARHRDRPPHGVANRPFLARASVQSGCTSLGLPIQDKRVIPGNRSNPESKLKIRSIP